MARIATTTAWVPGNRLITQGDLVEDDDPILRTHGALFADPNALAREQVEQATAAPGERRAVRRAKG